MERNRPSGTPATENSRGVTCYYRPIFRGFRPLDRKKGGYAKSYGRLSRIGMQSAISFKNMSAGLLDSTNLQGTEQLLGL